MFFYNFLAGSAATFTDTGVNVGVMCVVGTEGGGHSWLPDHG